MIRSLWLNKERHNYHKLCQHEDLFTSAIITVNLFGDNFNFNTKTKFSVNLQLHKLDGSIIRWSPREHVRERNFRRRMCNRIEISVYEKNKNKKENL